MVDDFGLSQRHNSMAAFTYCGSGHFTGPSVGPTDALLLLALLFPAIEPIAGLVARPHLVFIRDTRSTELM